MNNKKQTTQTHIIIKSLDSTKNFDVTVKDKTTLLESLCYIQEKLDSSIAVRWNCRSGQCGICGVLVNGVPRLACREDVFPGQEYIVEPILPERHRQSLICDVSDVYKTHFLTSKFYWQSELQHKEDFETLLSKIKQKVTLDISLEDIETLRTTLLQLTDYTWFEACFQGNVPGQIPSTFPHRDVLLKCKLIDSTGKVRYRLNNLYNCVFVTDGPWNIHNGGIFPYSDESEQILEYVTTQAIDKNTHGIVDIGCGCGHVSIAYWGDGPRFAFDINPRAGYFVAINAIINQRRVYYKTLNIAKGLPTELRKVLGKKTLFVVNMPHALSPSPGVLPKTSDGGETGLEPTIAALNALLPFRGSAHVAIVLCYSLGNLKQNRWDIVEQAKKLFQEDTIQWKLLRDTRIWRINGKKEQPNPMILREGLPKKADCRLYVKDENREKVRQSYNQLVDLLEGKGWEVLGCGILRIWL
ncbi:2Fe-2S iron-sulfur cluster-binding protein [Dehalococcoidia bacterium]|nr:2Fe-2S iron-sulfur cluster-binding protein [Dehalococcoidia bacterium]